MKIVQQDLFGRGFRKVRIDRLEFGNQQFGCGGMHLGNQSFPFLMDDVSEPCTPGLHHHHDEFCSPPTIDEIIMAGLNVRTFRPRSRK